MSNTCSTCIGVLSLAKKPKDGVKVVQRKKNLGLLASACLGHMDCMNIFINQGADVNCTDSDFNNDCRRSIKIQDTSSLIDGYTPLIFAVALGHIKTIKLLVSKGADVNVVRNKSTALGTAVRRATRTCAKYLIEAGANVNVEDPAVKPALMYAVCLGSSSYSQKKCVDMLIKAGSDVNACYSQTTVLLEIIRHGKHCVLNTLSTVLEAGADVNMGNKGGLSLHAALYNEWDSPNFEFIELLMDAGADVNLKDGNGTTPLHVTATGVAKKDSILLLLESGAEVNALNNRGETPLMTAADQSSVFLDDLKTTSRDIRNQGYRVSFLVSVRLFLEAGAQINRRNCDGNNALRIVCSHVDREGDNYQLDLCVLLYAAGETLDGPTGTADPESDASDVEIPKCFKELEDKNRSEASVQGGNTETSNRSGSTRTFVQEDSPARTSSYCN